MPCPSPTFSGEQFQNWRFRNWLGNVSVVSERHFVPDSLQSLVRVVTDAAQEGRSVRAIGRGWSFENIAAADTPIGWTVSLSGLTAFKDEIVSGANSALNDTWRTRSTVGDPTSRPLVCVEAGIRLRALNLALDDRGLAMVSLGGSQGQTVGGATSTSTHGGDIDIGPVSDLIRAVHLVTTGGREMWIESGSDPLTQNDRLQALVTCPDLEIVRDDELLHAVQVGIGCFGIVYAVVLEVRAAFGLYEESSKLYWSDVSAALTQGAGTEAPLQPLFDTLPAPSHNEIIGDPARPRFLEILLSSRSRGACHVRRRWETSAAVTVDRGEGGGEEIYCNPIGTTLILKAAASVLRICAGAVAGIPFYGAARAIDISRRAFELDVLSLVVAMPGGEAIATAANAVWWADDFHVFGEFIDWLAQDRVDSFISQRNGKVGPSWQIMIGVGEGGGPCQIVNSAEIVFSLESTAYIDYLNWLLSEGRPYRQTGYISVRFGKPSEALLSMHNLPGPHVVSIEVTSVVGFDHNAIWFEALEAQALALGGRPHWGQQNRLKADQVRTLYGDSLLEWRSQLGRVVGGGGRDFVNDYAEQRGLLPTAPMQRVTAVRRRDGRIAELCDPPSEWRVSVEDAIGNIDRGWVTYYIQRTPDAERNALIVRRVLTTSPDESRQNNLDALPRRNRQDGFPPSTAVWHRVTSVERDDDGSTLFLNNDDEGWSVSREIAWWQVRTNTASYFIQPDAGERNDLHALAYLTTTPDASAENNLASLPELG